MYIVCVNTIVYLLSFSSHCVPWHSLTLFCVTTMHGFSLLYPLPLWYHSLLQCLSTTYIGGHMVYKYLKHMYVVETENNAIRNTLACVWREQMSTPRCVYIRHEGSKPRQQYMGFYISIHPLLTNMWHFLSLVAATLEILHRNALVLKLQWFQVLHLSLIDFELIVVYNVS